MVEFRDVGPEGDMHGRLRTVPAHLLLVCALVLASGLTATPRADAVHPGHDAWLVTPIGLTFEDTTFGTAAAPQAVVVTNLDDEVRTVSIDDLDVPADFTVDDGCTGVSLAPEATCEVAITFTPRGAGQVDDTLSFSVDGQPAAIEVGGYGTGPLHSSTPVVDFGRVGVGSTTSAVTADITNVSSEPVVMSGTGGAVGAPFSASQNCHGNTLAPGASCQMFFRFAPTGTGPATATSSITWTGQSFDFELSGTGVAALHAAVGAVDFGDVPTGVNAGPIAVDITNVSSEPVVMSGTGGAVGAPFSASQNCHGNTLAPGASCQMVFRFAPTETGPATATSSITWTGQSFDFELSGRGVAASATTALHAPVTAVDFGDVGVGTTNAVVLVDIVNAGTDPVVMSGAGGAVGAPFSASQNCQENTLEPGEDCQMSFRFLPTQTGAATATSSITWNGQPFEFELVGTGVPGVHSPTPVLDLGALVVGEPSMAVPVDVVNVSRGDISMSGAGGAPGAPFSASQNCQENMLAPGEDCQMFFRFTPTWTGPATGASNITWTGNAMSFALMGHGLGGLRITPTGLDFGDVERGQSSPPQSVVVRNPGPGTVAVEVADLAVPDDMTAEDACAGTTLAPGTSCEIGFAFAPDDADAHDEAATFTLNGRPVSIRLVGDGFELLPPDVDPGVDRLAGDDRYETAVAVALDRFDPADVEVVYLATGADFPDALAGVPLAAAMDAPILLTRSTSLPAVVQDAIETLTPSTVVALGGPAAVADEVLAAAGDAAGAEVERLFGTDRYATAAAIAGAMDTSGVDRVFLATGLDFPDALAGGPTTEGAPILLTRPDRLPAATAGALGALDSARVIALGGASAVGEDVLVEAGAVSGAATSRIAGDDRFATAAALAATVADPSVAYVAVGTNFPDALAAGSAATAEGAPILLTRTGALPDATVGFLEALASLRRIVVLGGEGAVSADVADALGALLD